MFSNHKQKMKQNNAIPSKVFLNRIISLPTFWQYLANFKLSPLEMNIIDLTRPNGSHNREKIYRQRNLTILLLIKKCVDFDGFL